MTEFSRKVTCAAQSWPFAAGKWAVGVGTSIVSWTLEFTIAESLAPAAATLSDVYDVSLVGPLGARQLAWTAAVVVGGWHVLRARTARGLGEVASTFAIALVGGFIVAAPDAYLDGAISAARNTSTAVFDAVGTTVTGSEEDDNTTQLRDMMHQAFVAEPYDWVNWGERLAGPCADTRDEILDEGPWGNAAGPRQMMRHAGCDWHADFNEYPTETRAVTSVVVGVAAIATATLMVLVALGLLIAQLTLVLMFALASIVFALAMFPGMAREILWWWLRRIAWAVLAAVAAAFLLSWIAVSVTVALTATTGIPLTQRALLVFLIALFAWKARSALDRVGETASRRVSHHAARLSPAQSGGQGLAPAGAGSLRTMSRQLAQDLPGGQWAVYRLDARRYGARGRRGGGFMGSGGFGGRRRSGRISRRTVAQAKGMARATGDELRAVRRGVKATAMAPITVPRAYQRTYRQATTQSRRARARLAKARATRREWTRNARHPAQAMADAHRGARASTRMRSPKASPPGGEQAASAKSTPTQPTAEEMEWM